MSAELAELMNDVRQLPIPVDVKKSLVEKLVAVAKRTCFECKEAMNVCPCGAVYCHTHRAVSTCSGPACYNKICKHCSVGCKCCGRPSLYCISCYSGSKQVYTCTSCHMVVCGSCLARGGIAPHTGTCKDCVKKTKEPAGQDDEAEEVCLEEEEPVALPTPKKAKK